MFLGYVRRHHVGLLALFVALGGTSYAAVKLPKNSVGTAQIKNKAVTQAKLSTATVKALKGAKGATGATGATGPAGAAGAKGDPGAPATLSAAVAGLSTAAGPAGGTATSVPAASVTLQKAGKILVVVTGTFGLSCGGGACTYEIGAKLDGTTPVTGADSAVQVNGVVASTKAVALAGMIDAPAGAHQIQLFHAQTGATTPSLSDDTRVVAIAIG